VCHPVAPAGVGTLRAAAAPRDFAEGCVAEETAGIGQGSEDLYDMAVVRGFALCALLWGVVGMSVGLLAALQLAWPELNFGPYLHFGRIRPIHTNAVIFGFTLGVVFAGSYYAVQRLCRVRLFSDALSRFHLWLWNGIIVAAAISLLLGHTTSKEYAELEWPLDIAVVVKWLASWPSRFLPRCSSRA